MSAIVKRYGFFFFLWIIPFAVFTQSLTNGFKISGRILGLHEGEKVTIELLTGNDQLTLVDSDFVKNEHFELSSIVPLGGPRMYIISFQGKGHVFKMIRLLLDNNQNILIQSGDIDKIQHGVLDAHVVVEGSPSNKAWLSFSPAAILYDQCYYKLENSFQKVKDSIGFAKDVINGIMTAREQIIRVFFALYLYKFPDEFKNAILFTIDANDLFKNTGHAASWISVFNNLDSSSKNSYYGKRLKSYLQLCIGEPFPDISFPKSDNKSLSIKKVSQHNKITLVNFYSSNSYKRKEYQEELKTFYNNYHNKGFTIVGISSDSTIEEFNKTLSFERYPWVNVIDLRGEIVDSVYHELGNPSIHNTTNVLLDSKGRIIAWDVSGTELQYYLWKAFGG